MNIDVDNEQYFVDFGSIGRSLQANYDALGDKEFPLQNGKKLDFRRKSLTRIAINTTICPIWIGIVRSMYEAQHLPIEEYVRHTDMLDYCVRVTISLLVLLEKDVKLYGRTSQVHPGSRKVLVAVSTSIPNTIEQGPAEGVQERETESQSS